MNPIIVHCPGCGAALTVPFEVAKAYVSVSGQFVSYEFHNTQVAHACEAQG